MKKAQVSVYIIIGVIVLAWMGIAIYQNNNGINDTSLGFSSSDLFFEKESLSSFIADCLQQSLESGMQNSDSSHLESYVIEMTRECIEDSLVLYQGKGISFDNIDSMDLELDLDGQSFIARLNYPLLMKKGDSSSEFGLFIHRIRKTIDSPIPTAISGKVLDDIQIFSEDSHAILRIPKGTVALNSDGTPVKEISMQIGDSPFDPNSISFIAYDLLPEGATFSGDGLELILDYSDAVEGKDWDDEDIKVSWYDKNNNKYVELETEIIPDLMQVKANIKHFSTFGLMNSEGCWDYVKTETIDPSISSIQYVKGLDPDKTYRLELSGNVSYSCSSAVAPNFDLYDLTHNDRDSIGNWMWDFLVEGEIWRPDSADENGTYLYGRTFNETESISFRFIDSTYEDNCGEFVVRVEEKVDCISSSCVSYFTIPYAKTHISSNGLKIQECGTYSNTTEIELDSSDDKIISMLITGNYDLEKIDGMIRIILIDEEGKEYLAFEKYHLLDELNGRFKNHCEETCNLGSISPKSIKLILKNASIDIDSIDLISENKIGLSGLMSQEEYKKGQDQIKIDAINTKIKENNLLWIAGETSVSRMSYSGKKFLFGTDDLPDLQGFEYYKGGIFEIMSSEESFSVSDSSLDSDNYPDSWDWRNRHSADDPDSPYYVPPPDPDEEKYRLPEGTLLPSNGWVTPIRCQSVCYHEGDIYCGYEGGMYSCDNFGGTLHGCGSCWAFSAVGAVELYLNLYYNDALNIDLSEQDVVSCSDAGGCDGGWQKKALNYINNDGIVDEDCFPYKGIDDDGCDSDNCGLGKIKCNQKCDDPSEFFKIQDKNNVEGLDAIKERLINNGGLSTSYWDWNHAMTMVGYGTIQPGSLYIEYRNTLIEIQEDDSRIGKTYWTFKNSWGPEFGIGGFANFLTDADNMGSVYIRGTPESKNNQEIRCVDMDNDGYCNWGISVDMPDTCPAFCKPEKDCDDSNKSLGPFDSSYNCINIDFFGSEYLSDSIPDEFYPGETKQVSITFRNTGTVSWTVDDGFKLGSCDDSDIHIPARRVVIPTDIYPDQEITFDFSITVPYESEIDSLHLQMLKEGVEWFGDVFSKEITVLSGGVVLDVRNNIYENRLTVEIDLENKVVTDFENLVITDEINRDRDCNGVADRFEGTDEYQLYAHSITDDILSAGEQKTYSYDLEWDPSWTDSDCYTHYVYFCSDNYGDQSQPCWIRRIADSGNAAMFYDPIILAEDCNNGIDDNNNGLIDCEDSNCPACDCWQNPYDTRSCTVEEMCAVSNLFGTELPSGTSAGCDYNNDQIINIFDLVMCGNYCENCCQMDSEIGCEVGHCEYVCTAGSARMGICVE